MARDPLKSYTLPGRKVPLKTGQGARKAKESPAEFLARVVNKRPRCPEPMDVMMTVLEGDENLVALYYGVDVAFVRDVCSVHKPIQASMMKARAIRVSRDRDGASVADLMKKEALEEIAKAPTLPTRERWPIDEKDRRQAIRDWLIDDDVLVLYEGDLSRVAQAGRVPLHQLIAMVNGDDVLAQLREIGYLVKAERMFSKLCDVGEKSTQPTAALKVIQALGGELGERFTERSKVDVRRVGFEAPDDEDATADGELKSVLRRVK